MKRSFLAAALAAILLGAALGGTPASAARAADKPTIVLVHGAFADASGYGAVITRLQRRGYPVIAPANPLRGPASDAAYVASVMRTIDGPIVLVAHSYGGAVASEAATLVPNVKALVYLDALALEEGESNFDIAERFPSKILPALRPRPFPQADGTEGTDFYIDPARFREVFAADVPARTVARMAAAQRPISLAAGAEKSTAPAWKTIPSWYLIGRQDQVFTAEAQRFMAERAGSHITEINVVPRLVRLAPGQGHEGHPARGAQPLDLRELHRYAGLAGVPEGSAELLARADVELGEDLAQVVLDGTRADEELGADLRVRAPVDREPGDLQLLGGQLVVRLDRPPANGLAGREQLALGALGERLRPDAPEELVGRAQLLARVRTAVLPAQPLAVHELAAGAMHGHAGPAQALDRLAVERLGIVAVAGQRARPGQYAERPVSARGAGPLLEPAQRRGRDVGPFAPGRSLDELGEHPVDHAEVLVLVRTLGRGERVGIAAETGVEDGPRELGQADRSALAPRGGGLRVVGRQPQGRLLLASPGGQQERVPRQRVFPVAWTIASASATRTDAPANSPAKMSTTAR